MSKAMTLRTRRTFFFASLALVGILAVLPTTRWIVRTQLRLLGGRALPGFDDVPGMPSLVAAASAKQDDFDRQWALAQYSRGVSDQGSLPGIQGHGVLALLRLEPRFADRPELAAGILRRLCYSDLKIGRDDERLLLSPNDAKNQPPLSAFGKPTAAALTLAERTARQGAALDPGNAFFPAMQAVALFGERRDSEAIAALEAASQMPRWNDYTVEEVWAQWRLLNDANGEIGNIPRLVVAFGQLLPHNAKLRALARLATALAVRREQAGDVEGGFALRRAVGRLGALIRAQSTNEVGVRVAGLIVQTASSRPGNAPALKVQDETTFPEAENTARYSAYLCRIGHPEEARWYVAERQQDAHPADRGAVALALAYQMAAWWSAGLFLLMSALWVLAIGAAAAFCCRARSIRDGNPLRWRVRLSGLVAVTMIVTWFALLLGDSADWIHGDYSGWLGALATTVVTGTLFAVALWRMWREHSFVGVLHEIWKGALALVGSVLLLAVLVGLGALSCCGLAHGYWLSLGVFGIKYESVADFWPTMPILGLLALAVPILTMAVLAIRSRVRRVPVTVGIVRGMRGGALRVAATLLLLYAVALIGIGIEEALRFPTLQAIQLPESRYEAQNR